MTPSSKIDTKINTAPLLAANPIAGVVGARLALSKDGAEFKASCPFHDDATPSFYVVPEKGFYHCFGCGAHGDAIDFVMTFDRLDFRAACRTLGAPAVPPPADTPPAAPPSRSPATRRRQSPAPRRGAPGRGFCGGGEDGADF